VKPEFWTHPVLGRQAPEVQLLALGLLNLADDEGYFLADSGLVRFWEDEYGPISPARATLALYGSIGKGTPSLKLSRCESEVPR